MTELTKEKIAELRRLLEKATIGEWSVERHDHNDGEISYEIWELSARDMRFVCRFEEDSDDRGDASRKANFLLAMRNALPALLNLAERGIKCGQPDNPIASIDEGAPRPETWKERAENRQAVFLLAKRRAEAAETRAEELEKALDREIAHADELRQSATSATMREDWDVAYTSLRRARSALEGRE